MTWRSDSLYVFALAEPGLPRRFTILGRGLHTLPMDGVDVIVERGGRPELTSGAIQQQHELVSRLSARGPAILPARYGSVTDSPALKAMVSRKRAEILEALAQVRGCVQMTVRIFGAGASSNATPSRSSARSGTEFMQRLQARIREVPPEAAVVRRAMSRHVRADRVAAGERQRLVTVFHLVPQDGIEAYRAQASTLQALLQPLTVTVTGPWPVFAFVPDLF